MRTLLVGAELEENLAIRYLAASLDQAGFSADLARFNDETDAAQVIVKALAGKADVIGLSVTFQRRAHEFGRLAKHLREAGFKGHIVAGGHFPTFAYREYLAAYPAIDSVVRHEGERAIIELVSALANNTPLNAIAGLVFREGDQIVANAPRPLEPNLDTLPMPMHTHDPQIHLGVPAGFLVGSRGCYGHCTFCCIHGFVRDAGGEKYRARSADNLADEVEYMRRKLGMRLFIFHDDDFFTRDHARDLNRVLSLEKAFHARGLDDIALVVKARPDDIHEDIFMVMKRIGLLRVYVGIESGSTQGLRTLARGVTLQQNQSALDFLRKMDVYACYNLLAFDPDSTLGSLRDTFAFAQKNADIAMNFCRTEVYVGTPLASRLRRENRLSGDVFGWDYRIANPRAEQAFRIFVPVFYDRNFRCNGLSNSNLGLGYHLHLLKHFYPHAFTPSVRSKGTDVIRKVNLDSASRMMRIFDFCEVDRSQPEVDDFTSKLYEETKIANESLEQLLNETNDYLAQTARSARTQRSPLWKAVSAATLALSPLSCTPKDQDHVANPPCETCDTQDAGKAWWDHHPPIAPDKDAATTTTTTTITRNPNTYPTVVDCVPMPVDPPPPPTYNPPPPTTYAPPPDPPPPPPDPVPPPHRRPNP